MKATWNFPSPNLAAEIDANNSFWRAGSIRSASVWRANSATIVGPTAGCGERGDSFFEGTGVIYLQLQGNVAAQRRAGGREGIRSPQVLREKMTVRQDVPDGLLFVS